MSFVTKYAIVHGSKYPEDIVEHLFWGGRPLEHYENRFTAEQNARPYEKVFQVIIQVREM